MVDKDVDVNIHLFVIAVTMEGTRFIYSLYIKICLYLSKAFTRHKFSAWQAYISSNVFKLHCVIVATGRGLHYLYYGIISKIKGMAIHYGN